MRFIADFHIHSSYSRATAKNITLDSLSAWGKIKGITLIGTGDFTHPAWFRQMKERLLPDGGGFLRLKKESDDADGWSVPASCSRETRFIITGEISSIYKYGDKTRKVHNLIIMPDLDSAARFNQRLGKIGNIVSDGRPILGLDSRDLLEIMLEVSDKAVMIPAHIWTPWFSVLGSKSGFDSIEECYRDLASHIFALETGLSSDPPMNWMVSSLDKYTLVSNSDAHSASKLGREASVFDCEPGYDAVMNALKRKDRKGYQGTLEFFPEEGKYHVDGHRVCEVRLMPEETRKLKGVCPKCGGEITVGVLNRVAELGDRKLGYKPAGAPPFHSIVSLQGILGEIIGTGPTSKKVVKEYRRLIEALGPELEILLNLPLETVKREGPEKLSVAIGRMREGKIKATPGYDGEFGVIKVLG